MDFKEMVIQNRSYRRFDESYTITRETLVELIALARCTASAANLQPLKYILSCEKETNDLIFPCLAWAGYLKDWDGPSPGERPTAYVIILHDETITKNVGCDHGISAQTILLGAVERGLGGCMIASIKKDILRKELDIPQHLKILLVTAMGKPAEKVVLEDVKPGGDIKYWRDENDVHHVPKRPLDELIIGG
ncbi:MAG: nitroreductase family protein [Deltaproteobacteria bacterium]|nr:nitroreductase family protein [Deltaproteobacteria bacterium]